MTPEETIKDQEILSDPAQVLSSIKDQAVILGMASEYVCEARVLIRMGQAIEKDVERLKALIDDLRGQFVGKPPHDTDLDPHLEGLYDIAERLKSPEAPAEGRAYLEGLGRELGEKIRSLGTALEAFKMKLHGEPISYTTTDYALTQLEKVRPAIGGAAKLGSRLLKLIVTALLAAGVFFLVLFLTMEKEEVFLKAMEEAKGQAQSRQAELVRIDAELSEIRKALSMMRADELSREEKVHVLDLNVKAHNLRDKKDRIELEVRECERARDNALKRLEELRSKTLLQRLLRQ